MSLPKIPFQECTVPTQTGKNIVVTLGIISVWLLSANISQNTLLANVINVGFVLAKNWVNKDKSNV